MQVTFAFTSPCVLLNLKIQDYVHNMFEDVAKEVVASTNIFHLKLFELLEITLDKIEKLRYHHYTALFIKMIVSYNTFFM